MKISLLILSVLFQMSNQLASACSCSQYLLDPADAIRNAARIAIDGGRSTHIISEEDIKAYPSLWEKLNIGSFKGSSCEIHGPNGESLHYCAPHLKVDTKIIATKAISPTQTVTCTVVVRSVAKYKSVSAKVISKTCE